jgi:hypothetical protein
VEPIEERTPGRCRLATCRRILDVGADETYDGIATKRAYVHEPELELMRDLGTG